jgi:NADH-quinone oxidoreductase subunit H
MLSEIWHRLIGFLGSPAVLPVVAGVAILGFIMLTVLVMILALRRVMASFQSRIGPNRVGPQGSLQTVADAIKLLQKEDIIPCGADKLLFTLAPAIVFIPAYLVYVVMPFGDGLSARDLNIGLVYISAITSIALIGIIIGGWASNNKWSLLGAFRAAAQLVAYEVPMVLALSVPVLIANTLSLQQIVQVQSGGFWHWLIFTNAGLPAVAALMYLTAGLAEVNHTPFDIMEAESELVAGFNVEYSGMKFALFFLEEFAGSFTIAAIGVTLFLGGWHAPLPFLAGGAPGTWIFKLVSLFWFLLKSWSLVLVMFWIRSTFPRVRVDQLMNLGWKVLIPSGLVMLLLTGVFVAVR